MNDLVIEAGHLFKAAMGGHSFTISQEDCKIFYVPNMVHSHRTFWVESNLLIFSKTNIAELTTRKLDYISEIKAPNVINNKIGRVYFYSVDEFTDMNDYIIEICCNFTLQNYSTHFIAPDYIEIDLKLLQKITNLLCFI